LWIDLDYVSNSRGFAVVGLVVLFLVALKLRLEVPGLRLVGNPGTSIRSLDDLFADIFANLAGLYGYPRLADGGENGTVGVESTRIDEEGEYGDQDVDAADLKDILIGVGAESGIDEGCRSDGQQDEDKEEEGCISCAVEDYGMQSWLLYGLYMNVFADHQRKPGLIGANDVLAVLGG
jgi:hypothetical protein